MKGKLIKQKDNWYVTRIEEGDWDTHYPLHPDDVNEINAWEQIFDNIEARIAANQEVEFKIVKENVDTGALEAPYIKVSYARLINKGINNEKK